MELINRRSAPPTLDTISRFARKVSQQAGPAGKRALGFELPNVVEVLQKRGQQFRCKLPDAGTFTTLRIGLE